MRKLAARLHITATTIYNSYKNKDDLFINLLILGFTQLYENLERTRSEHDSPRTRLNAMMTAYTDFGLTQVNFYNLMYAWHVPKYNTYAGTAMEPVARQQLEIALKIPGIFTAAVKDYADHLGRVLPKLENTGLAPCPFFKDKAMVSLIFFNYQEVTIGAYDEVVISIMVYPEALGAPSLPIPTILLAKKAALWKRLGAYILEMPVTIPAARAAGREIWGFPKFLTTISSKLSGNYFEFGVTDPDTGEAIVDVKGEMGTGISSRAFDLVSFNNYDGTIFRVETEVDGKMKNCTCLNPGRPVADWPSPPLPYPYAHEVSFYEALDKILGHREEKI